MNTREMIAVMQAYGDGKVAYQARDLGNRYSKCRPRMNHIHAWQGVNVCCLKVW